MKTTYTTILVLVIAAVVLLAVTVACEAVEKKEKSFWSDKAPNRGHKGFELTDEAIERIMGHLAETEPEKAEELAKLRVKDLEKFKDELRNVMRRRFREKRGQEIEGRFGRGLHSGSGDTGRGRREGGGRERGMLGRKHGEHLEWMKKNYPERAKKLAELREAKPELFERRLGLSLKKYGRIAEAAKENPELAKVLKESLELKQRRDKLLAKIKTAANDDEKEELIEQLKEVVSSRFDLIVRRKQIEYESLLKKLEWLKKQVEKSEVQVDKWKDVKFKNKNVKTRIKELIGGTEKFRWD